MRKITTLLSTFSFAFGMLAHAQTTLTETVDVDVAGIESRYSVGDPGNVYLTIPLDGFADLTDCEDPVLELTGIGWDTNQTANSPSWLSEMVIGFDPDLDGAADLNLTPGNGVTNSGSGSYSSNGVIDLAAAGISYFLVANDISGSMSLEFFEGFDDASVDPDGVYDSGSITIEYRLSCSNTLGVNESSDLASVTMYPNLVNDFVTFVNPRSVEVQFAQIYDISGKLVQSIDLSDMGVEKRVDVSELASANYIVKIQSGSGVIVKKLIKQ